MVDAARPEEDGALGIPEENLWFFLFVPWKGNEIISPFLGVKGKEIISPFPDVGPSLELPLWMGNVNGKMGNWEQRE